MLFRGAFQAFLSAAIILAVDDVGGVLVKGGKRKLGPRRNKKMRKTSSPTTFMRKTSSPTTLISTCQVPDFLDANPTLNFKVIQSLASEPAVVINVSILLIITIYYTQVSLFI